MRASKNTDISILSQPDPLKRLQINHSGVEFQR